MSPGGSLRTSANANAIDYRFINTIVQHSNSVKSNYRTCHRGRRRRKLHDCCGREKVGRLGRTVGRHCVMPPRRRAITAVTTTGRPSTAATTIDDAPPIVSYRSDRGGPGRPTLRPNCRTPHTPSVQRYSVAVPVRRAVHQSCARSRHFPVRSRRRIQYKSR